MDKKLLQTIVEPSLDITEQLLELSVDQLANNDVITKLPVVGGFIALGKTAFAIKDALYVKNLLAFLSAASKVDASTRQQWLSRLESAGEAAKAGEVIFSVVDRLGSKLKNRIAGILFAEYISGSFTLREFEHRCEKLERLYVADILMLQSSLPQHDDDKERFFHYGLYSSQYPPGVDGSKFILSSDKKLVPNKDLEIIIKAIKAVGNLA